MYTIYLLELKQDENAKLNSMYFYRGLLHCDVHHKNKRVYNCLFNLYLMCLNIYRNEMILCLIKNGSRVFIL